MQDVKEMLAGREETAFAFVIGDRYIAISEVTGGYDYSIRGMDFQEIDRGLYDSKDISIAEVLAIVFDDILALPGSSLLKGSINGSSTLEEIDYVMFAEKAGF